jgi:hypothetical protein
MPDRKLANKGGISLNSQLIRTAQRTASYQGFFSPAGNWFLLTVLVAVVFGLPALPRTGNLVRYPFDEHSFQRLRAAQPDCVLIGDSMLRSRIDPEHINQIADRRCAVLAYPGSGSALWYLALKNMACALPHAPSWCIILFRDRQLTLPTLRTEGRYRSGLECLMRDSDPQFERTLENATLVRTSALEKASLLFYPLQRHRRDLSENVREHAMDLAIASSSQPLVRRTLDRIFDLKNLRSDLEPLENTNPEDIEKLEREDFTFERAANTSFLPMMLETARLHRTKLLFFRVKCRPRPDGDTALDRPGMKTYQAELRSYLQAHGAALYDESQDQDVTASFYGEGDHVSDAMMRPYTDLFWRKLKPVLDSAPGQLDSPAHP